MTPNPNDPKKPANPQAKPGIPVSGSGTPRPAGAPQGKPGIPVSGSGSAKPGVPGAKPPVPGQARPGVPASGAPKPPVKPGVPSSSAPKPPTRPAAPPPKKTTNKLAHIDNNTRQLGQKLVDLGYLEDSQLDSIFEEMRTIEASLGDIVKERSLVTADQLLQATAEVHGMKMSLLDEEKPTADALKRVPQTMAELYKLVPISIDGDTLTVAMSDPNNMQALDDIRNFLGIRHVIPILAPAEAVDGLMSRSYAGKDEESIASIIAAMEADPELASKGAGRRETSIDLNSLEEQANSAPVRKLINMVMLMAIRDHASDIHFEPFEEEYKMRYKCDGVLYEMVPPPRHLASAIASRIKVMSNLDIAERRLPQDGRIELTIGANRIDMRVSVLPTMFGESVVIRVLDKSSVGLELDRIGMPPEILSQFRQVIKKPNGIVLVTGPTGSGKTTTLYSALNELNEIDTKIITTEDPVEYEIDGIIQCPINADIEFTFASALRAILRQDPDVILVGEIRDLETAQIAIQASLTGHLVFSTLHTNDAPSSVTRLRDMGVEPYLITATVEAIQAQRLVRKICANCRTGYDPTRDQLLELNLSQDALKGRQFFYGEGCDKCNNLGFKGRTGVYELLIMNDDLRDMISKGCSTDHLRQYCRKKGVASLRDAGLRALFDGLTTLDEVVRETVLEDD